MAGFNAFGPVYIDGVPVKISEEFRPPPKISLPPNFEIGNPTEVLFLDYDFSLEERVLSWTGERERKIQQEKEKERLARIEAAEAKKIAQKSDTENGPFAENSDTSSPSTATEESANTSDLSHTGEDVEEKCETIDIKDRAVHFSREAESATVTSAQPVMPSTFVPVTQPYFAGASSNILKPLPAVKADSTLNTHRRHSSFDPKDFENELDPFDRIELTTLDDMKELDKVLQNVQISPEVNKSVSEKSSNGPVLPVKGNSSVNGYTNTSVLLQQGNPSQNISPSTVNFSTGGLNITPHNASVALNTQTNSVNYAPSSSANSVPSISQSNHMSYKPVPPGYFNHVAGPVNHSSAGPSNLFPHQQQQPSSTIVNAFPSTVSYNSVTSAMYGSVTSSQAVVPGTVSTAPSNSNQLSGNNGIPINIQTSSQPSSGANVQQVQNLQVQNSKNQYEIWREFLQKNSDNTMLPHSSSMAGNSVSLSGRHFPNGYVTSTEKDSSVAACGSKSQGNSRSHTPTFSETPRLKSARSTPDLASLESSPQRKPSNPVAPNDDQPLATVKDPATSNTYISKHETSSSSSNSSGITDHYRNLSREDQRFVDSVTNMGFKRTIVSKAVKRIGHDEKQVLDFLCGLTRLKDKGFSETEAEEVLILMKNDHTKAQSFLALRKRFQEFGFENAKVKEGLLHCDLDEEKTLDWLTTH